MGPATSAGNFPDFRPARADCRPFGLPATRVLIVFAKRKGREIMWLALRLIVRLVGVVALCLALCCGLGDGGYPPEHRPGNLGLRRPRRRPTRNSLLARAAMARRLAQGASASSSGMADVGHAETRIARRLRRIRAGDWRADATLRPSRGSRRAGAGLVQVDLRGDSRTSGGPHSRPHRAPSRRWVDLRRRRP